MYEILYTKQTQQRAYSDQILLSYFDPLVCKTESLKIKWGLSSTFQHIANFLCLMKTNLCNNEEGLYYTIGYKECS